LKEFGVVKSMFKPNIKKQKKKHKLMSLMRYKRKTKQNRKNYGVYFHGEKNGMCTGKKKSKYT